MVVAVLAAALAVGCSSSVAGIPGAQTTKPAASSSAPPSGLAALQPCEIFTGAEAAQLGLPETGEYNTLGGSRSCGWTVSGSHLLGVGIWDKLGFDDMNIEGRVSPTQVGRHKARRIEENSGRGMCEVLLEVSESSSVTVTVVGDTTAKACRLVEQAAPIVERKLP